MATQIRSSFVLILASVRARLVSVLEFPASRVVPVIRGEVPHFQGDQDVLLRPRGFRVDKPWSDGGGRHSTRVQRRLEIVCRTRCSLDSSGEAALWLSHETHGHFGLEELAANALQGFLPTDDPETLNVLVTDPLELLEGDDPKQDGRPKPQDWGETSLFFLCSYLMDFDQELSPI